MDKCQEYINSLIDGSYQQMNDENRQKFEKEMDKDCLDSFNKMKSTLQLMEQYQVPDPGKEYWDNYWDKLEERLETSKKSSSIPWSALMRIAAILFVGVFIGYLIFGSPDIPNEIADSTNPDIQMAALNKKTADVLEDSKILLLGIVNMNSPEDNSEIIDFSFQKKISNDLLLQTADLKQQLSKIKNRRMVSLINELELILMQIANLEDDFDLPAIEMVKQGAENQSLLFKINMEHLLMEAKKEHITEKKNKSKKEI